MSNGMHGGAGELSRLNEKLSRSIGKRWARAVLIVVGAVLLILAFFVTRGALQPSIETPRLVVLYATCSLNKDFLSPYNAEIRFTPHLDKIKDRSLVFLRHQTEAGQSGPSFASIFSGSQVFNHRVFSNGMDIPDSVELITETFAEHGYEVYSWLGHPVVSARRNFAQGVPGGRSYTARLNESHRAFQHILARLQDDPDYRAAVVTNFTVTHGPYSSKNLRQFCKLHPEQCKPLHDRPAYKRLAAMARDRVTARSLSWNFPNAVRQLGLTPEDVETMSAINEMHYKSNVSLLDRFFGSLFQAIEDADLLGQSMIIFTADHGETFNRENSHFKWTHGLQQAPEVLTVPWMLFAPGQGVKPGFYEGVTRSIDVFPTIAALSGIDPPSGPLFGRNLALEIRGLEEQPRLLAFSHTISPGDPARFPDDEYRLKLFPRDDPDLIWVSVRDGDQFYKLVSLDANEFHAELYDLAVDPGETRNLFDAENSQHASMIERLWKYKRSLAASHRSGKSDEAELSPDALEALRSLGYIE
jgi:arylsulfatase A-like enzyme